MALIAVALRPAPDDLLVEVLPKASDSHHCPPFTVPVVLYSDRAGRTWVEYECQVCGDTYSVPACLEHFGMATTGRIRWHASAFHPEYTVRGWSR